jgi:hypothetical protein
MKLSGGKKPVIITNYYNKLYEKVKNCDDDYISKPERYKCLGNTIDENIFNKHNDQEKKTLVKRNFVMK